MTSAFALSLPSTFLILGTAFGYAVATAGIKLVSQGHPDVGIVLGTLGFLLAFLAEALLMRKADLSVVYIAILVAETVLVMLYATMIGEGLSLRQALGAGLVLTGLAVVTL